MTLKAIPQRPMLYYELLLSDKLEVCDICNGTGANPEYADLNLHLYDAQVSWGRKEDSIIFVCCSKCFGDGHIDWINSITGNEPDEYDKLIIDLESVCLDFLISALIGPSRNYDIFDCYKPIPECWEIECMKLDMDHGLKCFNTHKSLVSKYMTDNLRSDFNRTINMALRLKGQACTNCFNLVTDEILYDSLKEKNRLIAVMPADEVNYKALITPEPDFPLFRLCDTCSKMLSKEEIDQLKKDAFNKDNNMMFSDEFYKKIYYGPLSEIFI